MAERRWREHPVIDAVSTWIVAHVPQLWGFGPLPVVLALSWHALRGIHTHEVRTVLRTLDLRAVDRCCARHVLNIAIMGLYDVMAFAAHARARLSAGGTARWRSAGATS